MITSIEAPILHSRPAATGSLSSDKPMLIGCSSTPFSFNLIRAASGLLQSQADDTGMICVTGSLHMVSSVLGQLGQ
ncbi:hypothetical protein E2562_020441 [Oryza meyeriana var. granulata]|uniref:Uncharacterized protein n=1 Tax=Oryza meyeriana var. granulata TaxID=110450 RepID=A0A6G1D5K9_9ORYZ|nr:hypothetical protein E2562_020441 [Oryza meyeriana var. granulata]